jgi:hypothetical protein
MVARATAPNRIGPGSVFPDASTWDFSKGLEGSPMASAPFWIAMICQIIIVVGYLWFYRKEQLGEFYLPCTGIILTGAWCSSSLIPRYLATSWYGLFVNALNTWTFPYSVYVIWLFD